MEAKILIVDDDLDSLKLISILLQRHGYHVITSPNGKDGLSKASTHNPDLILLDVMMPAMDGIEVCRQLKRDPLLSQIPVLMFTAKTRVDDKAAGFDAGADDYLTKPTHPAELASRIKALLARRIMSVPSIKRTRFGKVIAVLGIKGGSGVTTTAINLSLALAGTKKCILAELLPGKGAIGMNLGLKPDDGLSRLIGYDLETLDKEHLEAELEDYYPGLQLLTTTFNPLDASTRIPQPHIERIVNLLAQIAELVIVDLGSSGAGMAASTLKLADHVVVCMPPGRASLLMTESILFHLEKAGIGTDSISMVMVNTASSTPSLVTQELASRLDFALAGSIPAEPEIALQAIDKGRPILLLAPDSEIANQFRHLGQFIINCLEKEYPPNSQ